MPSGILLGQISLVYAVIAAVVWLATQWCAGALGNQAALGPPWFRLSGVEVYEPWRLFGWWFQYGAYAPETFARAGWIAASGGPIAWLLAIGLAVKRSRVAGVVTTYGSARWAESADVSRAGLKAADGLLVGACMEEPRAYLRHAGAEHVMVFAPTRSGKGVGLVVPTLLSWNASVVVHDIKGENWQITAGWRSRFSHCHLFNPTDLRSAAYNPLLEVRRGACEVRDVQNIADILVDPEGALDRRNHWEKTSHSLLVGAILHVLYAEPDKTLRGVANFLSNPALGFEETLQRMMIAPHLGDAPHPVVASAARKLLNKSENETLGCALDGNEFPGSVSRPHRRGSDLALRLAHRRPDLGATSCVAVSRSGLDCSEVADDQRHKGSRHTLYPWRSSLVPWHSTYADA